MNQKQRSKNMELTIYGSVSHDFKIIAQLSKMRDKIKSGLVTQTRFDCYSFGENTTKQVLDSIYAKFRDCHQGVKGVENMEVFIPTMKYPCHTDDGGISYFIPLEEGNFFISGVNYPVVPFVLYAFEDSKMHNTDFMSVMIK